MIYILIFSAAMMIKGGWLNRIPLWDEWEIGRKVILDTPNVNPVKYWFVRIADELLDEKIISAFVVWVGLSAVQPDFALACVFALVWGLVIRVSMGEEAGGIGDYETNTGDYVEWLGPKKGRVFAIKKGFQYGAFFGSGLTLVSGNPLFILAGLAFPLVYFIGNCLHRLIHKQSAVAYSEVIWGALFGLAWLA